MAKIKVLTIITKLELGGAQQVALNTLRALPKEQFQCYLIAGRGGLLEDEAQALEDVQVALWRSFKHPIRPIADLVTLIKLYQFIRKEGIDIVHTHSSKAGFLGRLAAHLAHVKKIIHTVHGWSFHDQQVNLKKSLFIYLEKVTAAKTHYLVAVSQATQAKGLANGIGRHEQYKLIAAGSELEAFGPGIVDDHKWLRSEFDFDGYPPVVAMISNLKPQKAPLDFVRAANHVHQQLPDVRFLLVGDGPLRKAVKHEIKRLGLLGIVKCAGWRQDIPDIMRGINIMVLSSLWEGLPCVFGQAMKTGLPIVATNVEGAQEAITDGETGYLVPISDPKSMAEKIVLILKDKRLGIKFGKAAMKHAHRFENETMTNAIIALYQSGDSHAPSH